MPYLSWAQTRQIRGAIAAGELRHLRVVNTTGTADGEQHVVWLWKPDVKVWAQHRYTRAELIAVLDRLRPRKPRRKGRLHYLQPRVHVRCALIEYIR